MPTIYRVNGSERPLYLPIASQNLEQNAHPRAKLQVTFPDGTVSRFKKEERALGVLERIHRITQCIFAYLKSFIFMGSKNLHERTWLLQTAWSGHEQRLETMFQIPSALIKKRDEAIEGVRKMVDLFYNQKEFLFFFSISELEELKKGKLHEYLLGYHESAMSALQSDSDLEDRIKKCSDKITAQFNGFIQNVGEDMVRVLRFTKQCQCYIVGNRAMVDFLQREKSNHPELVKTLDQLHTGRFHLSGYFSVLEEAKMAQNASTDEREQKLHALYQALNRLTEGQLQQMTLDVLLGNESKEETLNALRKDIVEFARVYTGLSKDENEKNFIRKIWEKTEVALAPLFDSLNEQSNIDVS